MDLVGTTHKSVVCLEKTMAKEDNGQFVRTMLLNYAHKLVCRSHRVTFGEGSVAPDISPGQRKRGLCKAHGVSTASLTAVEEF